MLGAIMTIYRVRIKEIGETGKGIMSFHVTKPEGFEWEEATHIHAALPDYDTDGVSNKALVHHLSIISLPQENEIIITTRLNSSDSLYKKRLANLQAGDELVLFKSGSYLRFRRDGRPVVLITMGVAAAVARPLVLAYLNNQEGIPSFTCISVNRERPIPFESEMDHIKVPGLRMIRLSHRSELQQYIDSMKAEVHALYLLLGSDEFLRDIILALRSKGIAEEDIVLDLKSEKRAALYERMGLTVSDSQTELREISI